MDNEETKKESSTKEAIVGLAIVGIILFFLSRKIFGFVFGIGTILYIFSFLDKGAKFHTYTKAKKIVVLIGCLLLAFVFFNVAHISIAKSKELPIKAISFNFSKAELNESNLKKAVSNIIENSKLKSVTLTIARGKNIVDVTYNPGEVQNEDALMQNTANTATQVYEELFKNPKVDEVCVWTETAMIDSKGNTKNMNAVNVALTKQNASNINWSNFKQMVAGDYNKLFDIADSKFIAPGVEKNLKQLNP